VQTNWVTESEWLLDKPAQDLRGSLNRLTPATALSTPEQILQALTDIKAERISVVQFLSWLKIAVSMEVSAVGAEFNQLDSSKWNPTAYAIFRTFEEERVCLRGIRGYKQVSSELAVNEGPSHTEWCCLASIGPCLLLEDQISFSRNSSWDGGPTRIRNAPGSILHSPAAS
jgi:hypothetical protein